MDRFLQFDEQTEAVSGKVAFVFLAVTQFGLLLAILVQRYLLGLPTGYYNDVALLMVVSVLGFYTVNLYMGGLLPALSVRGIVFAYVATFSVIAIPHLLLRGWPDAIEWPARLLGYFGLPTLFVSIYTLAAALGKKRIQRLLTSEPEHKNLYPGSLQGSRNAKESSGER